MDYFWTPWRYAYLTAADRPGRKGVPQELASWPGDMGCVFCNMLAATRYAVDHGMAPEEADRAAGIVCRAATAFLCLNRFPYTSGHVMIVPYAHLRRLKDLDETTACEVMRLAQRTETVLESVYSPDGMNLGINLGESAGAGVAGHLHMHALPRWTGDANFLSVIGETRVLPETLETTWERLRTAFAELHRQGNCGDRKE